MKSLSLLTLLIVAGFSAVAQFDSVLVSQNYDYSESQGIDYGLHGRTEQHFDSSGHVILYMNDSWDGYRFKHGYRTLYSYNAAGYNTEQLNQDFINGAWKNTYRKS